MRQKQLTTQLKQIVETNSAMLPRPEWLQQNRAKLLTRLNAEQPVAPRAVDIVTEFVNAFLPMQTLTLVARTMSIVLLAVVSVVGGGVVSAAAYKDAVPGEALYGAKKAVETAQLFVAPSITSKTKLYMEFADARIEEMSVLAEAEMVSHAKIEEAIRGYQSALEGMKEGVLELESRQAADTVDVAKVVERRLASHQDAMVRAKVLAPGNAPRIEEMKRAADAVSLTAMALLVEKHLAGMTQAPRELVQQNFEARIKFAEGELNAAVEHGVVSEVKAQYAKDAIAEAKQFVRDADYQAALSKIVEVNELTKEEVVEELEGDAENTETNTEPGSEDSGDVTVDPVIKEEEKPVTEPTTPTESEVPAEPTPTPSEPTTEPATETTEQSPTTITQ